MSGREEKQTRDLRRTGHSKIIHGVEIETGTCKAKAEEDCGDLEGA